MMTEQKKNVFTVVMMRENLMKKRMMTTTMMMMMRMALQHLPHPWNQMMEAMILMHFTASVARNITKGIFI